MSVFPEQDSPRDTAPSNRDDNSLDTPDQEHRTLPPISPADVGAASRSCLAILILGVATVLILCLAITLRTVL